ncbi:hypothetical protein [Chitinophaga rhizophila]|uniref:Uncharacterized protein n=1 Tax=Chitinophaga rhizophila TaxID=2866212 RepID=A0ABS7G767_9BACT|nr:hypothetical protein [Chitinophaga rhizophila]MBW8683502.1 hypothetical protein [Chitinophaga rhizophila]
MKYTQAVYVQHHFYDYMPIDRYASYKKVHLDFVIQEIAARNIDVIAVGTEATLMVNFARYKDFRFQWWKRGAAGTALLLVKQSLGIANESISVIWQDMPFNNNL